MTAVRWAVVGTGHMADQMADAIKAMPGAELVAVVGRTPDAARAFASRHGASAHAELAAALAADVDAVYIGSPNAMHAEHASRALAAGKHVLCDKPLATDVASAERLVAAAADAGRILSVNLQVRQHPALATVRKWLSNGAVGRVIAVRASIAFGTEALTGWRSEPELAGAAALYNLGIHAIDTVLALVAEPVTSVTGLLRPDGVTLDRTALVTISFVGGAVATILSSQELADDDVRIEILGSAGRITWDGWMAPYRSGPLVLLRADGARERHEAACPDAYERVVRTFTEAVGSGSAVSPTPEEALRTVRVVEAARLSPGGAAVMIR